MLDLAITAAVLGAIVFFLKRMYLKLICGRIALSYVDPDFLSNPEKKFPPYSVLLRAIGNQSNRLERRARFIAVRFRDCGIERSFAVEDCSRVLRGIFRAAKRGWKAGDAYNRHMDELKEALVEVTEALRTRKCTQGTMDACVRWIIDLEQWLTVNHVLVRRITKNMLNERGRG